MIRRAVDRAARVVRHLAHRATAPFLLSPIMRTGGVRVFYPASISYRESIDDPGVDVDRGMPDYSPRERGWMQTVTGRRFHPLDPNPDDIVIEDVAHGLAMCCRYAGHTLRFYSVAEHCVHVSRQLELSMRSARSTSRRDEITILEWSLAALLHDSSEAYIGDMIRPLKHQPEMTEFRAAEARIERTVATRFSLDPAAHHAVKEIDDRIIVDEVQALKINPGMYSDITVPALGVKIECWSPMQAKEIFLTRFGGLVRALGRE